MTAGGEQAGHPFRGNQWTEGTVSPHPELDEMFPAKPISLAAAGALVNHLAKHFKVPPVEYVSRPTDPADKKMLAEYFNGKIYHVEGKRIDVGTAIHEFAHHLADSTDPSEKDPHGPAFQNASRRIVNYLNKSHPIREGRILWRHQKAHGRPNAFISTDHSSLLSAVRAERLARRVEAVRAASGAFAAGHKFWGNQWSEHAKDLMNDPVGEPSGKIKHAVLVIGGKRYKGPSHFQASLEYLNEGNAIRYNTLMTQGFETESGHFLGREQAHEYTTGGKGHFDSGDIRLQATDGKLYTQDAVQATQDSKTVVKVILQDEAGRVLVLTDSRTGWDDLPGGHVQQGEDPVAGLVREVYEETGIRLVESDVKLYREQSIPKPHGGKMLLYKARADAAKVKISEEHSGAAWVKRDQLGQRNLGRYAKDVEAVLKPDSSDFHASARDKARSEHKNAALRALGLAAHAVAEGQTAEPGGKAKVVAGMLGFLALGAAAAYLAAHRELAEGEGVAPVEQEPEAEAHADSRTPLVKGAVEDAVAELEAEKAAVEKEQVARGTVAEGEVSKRLAKKARELEGARWERLADAEATATYGSAALRVLDLAGFATVRWSQLERPTKRHTHKLNQDQGEQPLGFVFQNGQAYPGDPARGPEENINCLCQLIGVRRKAEKVGASEQAGHPFHGNQYKQVGVGFVPPKFQLSKPIKGPTGAAIVGYEWRSTMGTKWNAHKQEEVEAMVSDWDNAGESTGTGRQIVHVFHVQHPDGITRPEGIRSAQNVLGISETKLMTIAKKEKAAQQYKQQQRESEAKMWDRVAHPTAIAAAQDYRKSNWSGMRSEEENNAIFYDTNLWTKGGKFIRRASRAADDMKEFGWEQVEPDPAKTRLTV